MGFPPNPFIPAWSLSKSLLCLLLHPGLEPFLFTWKQWWCHCYINRGLLCSVFQPGLWVNGMACLVIKTCFWKKSGISNPTWLVLKRKEYYTRRSWDQGFRWFFLDRGPTNVRKIRGPTNIRKIFRIFSGTFIYPDISNLWFLFSCTRPFFSQLLLFFYSCHNL